MSSWDEGCDFRQHILSSKLSPLDEGYGYQPSFKQHQVTSLPSNNTIPSSLKKDTPAATKKPKTDDHACDAARGAYQEQLYGVAAADSPRHQSGVRGAGAVVGNKRETVHDGGLSLDAARSAYLAQLHGETAMDYPSSYKGGGRGGGAVRDEVYKSGSEEDESESDEEFSRGPQGGLRRYDCEAYMPEKKSAGSNHDISRHYGYGGAVAG